MQVKASGTDHVFGAAHRRRLDVLEQQRDLLKNAQVRLVGRERVELAEKLETRPDALRLVTRVEDQDADLAPVLQGLEPFEGRVEFAPASTIQVERPHDHTNPGQGIGRLRAWRPVLCADPM